MYNRARFVSDFPWTAVPQCSFGSHRWVMPGEGWFSFIPESWIAPVYSACLMVDAALKRVGLMDLFVVRRIEIDDAIHVWYGFNNAEGTTCLTPEAVIDYALCDADEVALALQEIDEAFAYMTYVTSLILLDAEHFNDAPNLYQGSSVRESGECPVCSHF